MIQRIFALLTALLALSALTGCGYNDFQRLDEQSKAAWSEVLNQYQRRADLVPNIVATVKGEAAFEQDTLTRVIEARSRATAIQVIGEIADKDHGRVEVRTYAVSHDVAWLNSDRRYPGEYRFGAVKSLVKTTTSTHWRGKTTCETRYFISSAVLQPERAAEAIRAHWGIESLHWVLDVIFKEDQSRLRRGYGAQNMALVRRLAFNIVRAGRGKKSIKTARKVAAWNPEFLTSLLQTQIC